MTTRFSGIRSAARNSAYLVGTHYASIVIRILYVLILARSLTPGEYGILNYGLSWYLALIPLTYLGADVVLSRGIARRRDAAPALLGITLRLRCYAILIVVAASVLFAAIAEKDGQVRSLLLLFSLALIGRSLWMWTVSVFTAYEETRLIVRLEAAFRCLEVGALIAFLATSRLDLVGVAIIHAATWCLQGAVAIAAVRRRYPIELRRPDRNWAHVLREGIPGAIFAIAMAAFFQLPVVLFRQTEGTGDALGHFALAFQLLAFLQIIPYALATGSLPVLSRSAHRKDGKDRAAAYLLMAIIPLAGAILAMTASWFASPVIEALFGERYASAATLFGNALWLLIPMSLAMLFQQMLFSNAINTPVGAAAPILGVAAMAVTFPGLTRALGPSGAVASIGIGLFVWLAFAVVELARGGFFTNRLRQADGATRECDQA